MAKDVFDTQGNLIGSGSAWDTKPQPRILKKSKDAADFDKAKARKEAALADLHELDYKVKSGQYVSRDSVKQAVATAMAALAQGIRSLPDHLERRGVEPRVCVQIDAAITEALADTGKALEVLWRVETTPEDNSDLF